MGEYLGDVNPSFACSEQGIFGDVANECKIFHVCQVLDFPDGKQEIAQYSFGGFLHWPAFGPVKIDLQPTNKDLISFFYQTAACPNTTVFNQFSLTCADPSEAVPCASSPDFFYLNQRIGNEKALLHEDADVEKFGTYLNKQ